MKGRKPSTPARKAKEPAHPAMKGKKPVTPARKGKDPTPPAMVGRKPLIPAEAVRVTPPPPVVMGPSLPAEEVQPSPPAEAAQEAPLPANTVQPSSQAEAVRVTPPVVTGPSPPAEEVQPSPPAEAAQGLPSPADTVQPPPADDSGAITTSGSHVGHPPGTAVHGPPVGQWACSLPERLGSCTPKHREMGMEPPPEPVSKSPTSEAVALHSPAMRNGHGAPSRTSGKVTRLRDCSLVLPSNKKWVMSPLQNQWESHPPERLLPCTPQHREMAMEPPPEPLGLFLCLAEAPPTPIPKVPAHLQTDAPAEFYQDEVRIRFGPWTVPCGHVGP
ncbi:hypothetical protein NDU88_007889 [Pleurodeles waltl]|uniref:Uncharacterized protein n=1 Tax=Pleurodeles waltl TaxID=8319 RepID=A0AAV7VQZ7_PLEWA|nr:hypothetical protein NDU88_007889 [Pleurodeles waltl]